MNIEQVIKNRRSIRKFKETGISKEIIHDLIEAAQSAPSASNSQPWRFYILQSKEYIRQLKILVSDAAMEISKDIDERFTEQFEDYSKFFTCFTQAPLLIIPVYREYNFLTQLLSDDISQSRKEQIVNLESKSALTSTSLAIQNLMLYAHSIGLGTACMTGPIIAEQGIKKLLKIPPSWNIACFVAVGYPNENPPAPKKRNLETIIKWI